jgi:hypothetical protein
MGLLDDTYAKAKALAGLLADSYQTGAQAYFPNEQDVKARPDLAKGLLQFVPGPGDAISGYDAVQSARQGNYGEAALNGIGMLPFLPAMGGMIKETGNFSKKLHVPEQLSGKIVTPVMGSLPESQLYDKAGMFSVGTAGNGDLRKLMNGDYLAILTPQWLGKSKPYYAIGDTPEELVANVRKVADNSNRAITAARTAKIPKEVRGELEKKFGKNFSYDISNASNSNSYYITHKPSGTKIRVSDHDLPGYYENSASIDIRPEDIETLPALLSEFLRK